MVITIIKEMTILRMIENLGILMNNYLMTPSKYPVRLYAATTPSATGHVDDDPNHSKLYYPSYIYISQINIIIIMLFSIIIP
jgi:hypothetical protein